MYVEIYGLTGYDTPVPIQIMLADSSNGSSVYLQ